MAVHGPFERIPLGQAGIDQLGAVEHAARRPEHVREQPILGQRQVERDRGRIVQYRRGIAQGIELQRAEPDQRLIGARTGRAAQHGLYPRDHLKRIERFHDIVVGTDPQRGKLVEVLRPRSRHDDRSHAARAEIGQHRKAVPFRQANVEQDEIGLQRLVMDQRDLSVLGGHGPVSLALQAGTQDTGNLGFVLDDEDQGIFHDILPNEGCPPSCDLVIRGA